MVYRILMKKYDLLISEAEKYVNTAPKGNKSLSDATMDELVTELIKRCRNIEFSYIKQLRDDPRFEDNKNRICELEDEIKSVIEDIE